MKKRLLMALLLVFLVSAPATPAYANPALITRGVAKTLLSVFQIPRYMMLHSTRVIFPVGLVTGALEGTVRTVMGTVSGVVDIAAGAAPYAKYAAVLV